VSAVKRWLRPTIAVAIALVLGGCGGSQSTLAPRSPQAHDIATLWWWMLGIAAVVFFGAVALLVISWTRRRTPGLPLLGRNERASTALVIVFGIVIPAAILIPLFGVSDIYVLGKTDQPTAGSSAMTIRVIGHQWFWEVRYPGAGATTANEIHIPARTPVDVVATTDDVIHSFWVPQLNRKIDMIPDRRNRIVLYASRPGVYRGQCAEFCGLQHAHMAMRVFAQPRPAFQRWLRDTSKPARPPATPLARRGERVFMSSQCASCHTIGGTSARGTVGPDLTHVASRTTLAADTIPNTAYWLQRWIRDPQAIKPGNKMPDLGLRGRKLAAVVAYLRGLH
jgi:cytochrome c oxidase subunit II